MKQESQIRVLIVEPLKLPEEKIIENTLEAKQEIVGGYIEVISPFDDENVDLICHEEGKILGLPLNRLVGDGIIAGPFILAGFDDEQGVFISLTDEQIVKYTKMFGLIEIYISDQSPSFHRKEHYHG